MKLAQALNDKTMDVRVIDRLLAEGKISKSDFDKFMTNLPDETGNFDFVGSQEEVPAIDEEAAPVTE